MKKLLSIVLIVIGIGSFSQAALLLSESFEGLTLGDLNGQNSWTASTDFDVVAGGLNYSNGAIVINGGSNRVESSAGSIVAEKAFAAQTGEVWFSFTTLIDSSVGSDRFWFAVGETSALNTAHKGAIGDTNNGQKNFYAEYRINSTPVGTTGPAGSAEDVVHFLVGRLYKSATEYDKVDLWVNPDSYTLGAADLTATKGFGGVNASDIDTFSLNVLGSPSLQWDNLTVGTSMTDVVIPEASSLLLMGMGFLSVLGMSRRRRS